MSINETVLEMHFHKALVDLIGGAFGLGATGHYNFYKFSPQHECFIGFDQAFVKTHVSDSQIFKDLSKAASSSEYKLSKAYFGYFLQFKVVSRLVKFNKKTKTPPQVKNTPFFRTDIYNKRTKSSSYSQHELLFNLAKNKGAMTYYACPMIFNKEDLYKPADLTKLRLVDVSTAPSAFTDNESHHIFFPDEMDDPVWRSEPVTGRVVSANEFAREIAERANQEKNPAQILVDSLTWLREVGRETDGPLAESFGEFDDFVADTLTIVEVDRPPNY